MIKSNKTIKYLSLYKKRPWYLWLNTTPFFVLELLLIVPLFQAHFSHLMTDQGIVGSNDDDDSVLIGFDHGDVSEQHDLSILGLGVLWWIIALALLVLTHVGILLASYWSIKIRTFLQFSRVPQSQLGDVFKSIEQEAQSRPNSAVSRSSRRAAARKSTNQRAPVGEDDDDGADHGYILFVIPHEHKGRMELCPLKFSTVTSTLYFNYQKRRYQYNTETHKFEKPFISIGDGTLQSFHRRSSGISDTDVQKLTELHGPNRFDIPMPSFLELFKEHALAPFFVFQVFCVLLWCMDEYWYYSLMTLVMLFMFEGVVVKQRMRNLEQVKQMATKPEIVFVYRGRKWTEIMSDRLLPGDIISLVKQPEDKVCPCDVLLLEGKCVTNESLLTGESIPQTKESLQDYFNDNRDERSGSTMLDFKKKHKRHVIYGGTRIMHHQHAASDPMSSKPRWDPPNNGAVGVVLRTGFETAQGKLIRTILYTTERVSANNVEALLFILFLLVFAVMASLYVLYHGLQDPSRSRYKLLLNCVLIITSCVPPELPMELSMAVNTSLMYLVRFGVFCTEPFRIPFAGRVNVCCFDKTGTLTSDKMIMSGIAECGAKEDIEKDKEGDTVKKIYVSREAIIVLAGCHSLINLDGEVVGDPMEKAAVEATGFTVLSSAPASVEAVVVPQKNRAKGNENISQISILKRFAFTSELKRMSAVVKVRDEILIVSKGAPEVMKSMLAPDSVPNNYDDLLEKHALSGARVITLAYRPLQAVKYTKWRDSLSQLTRTEVEKDLIFAGFALFESDIKMGTQDAIAHLLESSHKVIMITGDNALTACHVAQKLHMVTKPVLVLTLQEGQSSDSASDRLVWHMHRENLPVFGDGAQTVDQLLEQYDLCVQGDALDAVLKIDPKWLERHAADIVVYARVAPEQKELILSLLKSQGNFTLMCGDGTNDVGALKQAHVGVALLDGDITEEKWKKLDGPVSIFGQLREQQKRQLAFATERKRLMDLAKAGDSEAAAKLKDFTPRKFMESSAAAAGMEGDAPLVKLGDASIASPFSSKYSTIRSTEKILQQGRCTLVTTLQMYKILALNCLVSAYSLSVLNLDGVKFGEAQMLATGLLIALCFLFISRAKPLDKLSSERPQSTVFSPYMMLSIMGQFAIHLVSLILTVRAAKSISPRTDPIDTEADYEPNLLNTTVFLITTAQTVATFANNYRGRPFMESLLENKPLRNCLSILLVMIIVLTLGIYPYLNEQLELTLIPSEHVPLFGGIIFVNLVGVFIYERLLMFLFNG